MPRFSLVSAVHDVQRYLPEYIKSVESQTFDLGQVEVIMVDDGSSDDSLALLQAWAKRRPELVTVLRKPNGGQGSARNLGLEHVHGEWVGFPDPDDRLDENYLATVDRFLRDHGDAVMIATARILFREASGAVVANHPLHHLFAEGDRLVDLASRPEFFHSSASAAFLRADLIAREDLRFDGRVRPNFEDGHFLARYLLASPTALVGFLGSARYIYRKRADGTSTLQNGQRDPDRFLAIPRYGYLDLLDRAARADGHAPGWLQNLVIYELSFYFSNDQSMSGATAAHGEVATQFLEDLRAIVARIDPRVIEGFAVRRLEPVWRDILLHGLSGGDWVSPHAVIGPLDPALGLVQIAYRFTGPAPHEVIHVDGRPVAVVHGKIWVHEYFEHPLMFERVAWVADGALGLTLDGHSVPTRTDWAEPTGAVTRPKPAPLRWQTRLVRALAAAAPVRRRFRDAWCLIDRVHDADDNAERLFRHLRDHRPDVNAWFVLERDTPDWRRLVRDGYGRRLIAYGGVRWRWLMLNCAHLISSHADPPVHRPPAITRMAEPAWRFTFLQHGVIKDDLSRWLNPKHIDLLVTSTPQEQNSIVDDYTPYEYTSKQARMTGLPRFDRLRELGALVPVAERRLVLVCPTWRYWLAPPLATGSHRRTVSAEFFESDYLRTWLEFLTDEQLHRALDEHDLQLGFLPHPNVQPALPQLGLPPHVQALRFAGQDVQRYVAEAAVMVTDYSSMAFNAAYIDRPVVYLQFDAELIEQGAHIGRPGYFDYARDGFGPVTTTPAEAVSAVLEIVAGGRVPGAAYRARIESTFTERDGRCCERTTRAIEDLGVRR